MRIREAADSAHAAASHLFDLAKDPWWRMTAGAVSLAVIAMIAIGDVGTLAVFVFAAILLVAVGRAASDGDDRPFLIRLMLLSLAGRAILAAVLHVILVARGSGGAMFLDDAGYTRLATDLARSWRGVPMSETSYALLSDPSIASGYVLLGAATMWLVGESALAMKLMNVLLGVMQGALVYRTMRNLGLPGARLATAVVLVFPSLVLWSVLALKDTFALTAVLTAIWSASEFHRGGRWRYWFITIGALVALRDVRLYAFLIVAAAWPIGLFIGSRGHRRAASVAALLVVVPLVLTSSAAKYIDPDILGRMAYVRSAMAVGARSAYVEPPPVSRANPGTEFRVEVAGVEPTVEGPQRRHDVPAGSQLVIEGESPPPTIGTQRPTVVVRPGDIVVIVEETAAQRTTVIEPSPTAAAGDPAPSSQPSAQILQIQPDRANIVETSQSAPPPEDLTLGESLDLNLRHLPIGLLFLIGAPFPLSASNALEIAMIPEMLLWYVVLPFALLGLAHMVRRRDVGFTFGILVALGIGLVLSLVEGNVGTLVRHRSMLIPFVVILAASGAVWTVPRLAPAYNWLRRSGDAAHTEAATSPHS